MGGKGSGGRRVNAGRKRKSLEAGTLSGSRRVQARNKTANQTANQTGGGDAPAPVDAASAESPTGAVFVPQPPGSLTLDELAEWNDLAPRALKEGTLTDSTMLALRDLCQARVLKDKLLRTVGDQGNVVIAGNGNLAAHPLLARFTTLFQRVEAGMIRFKLAPMGKELTESEKPADPFADFDADSAPASQAVN